MDMGTRLRERRRELKLTQQQLADAVRLSVKMIRDYEANKSIPAADTLGRLASALHVSMQWLWSGEGEGASAPVAATSGPPPIDRSEMVAKVEALKEDHARILLPIIDQMLGARRRRHVENNVREYLEQVRLITGPEPGQAAKVRVFRPPERYLRRIRIQGAPLMGEAAAGLRADGEVLYDEIADGHEIIEPAAGDLRVVIVRGESASPLAWDGQAALVDASGGPVPRGHLALVWFDGFYLKRKAGPKLYESINPNYPALRGEPDCEFPVVGILTTHRIQEAAETVREKPRRRPKGGAAPASQ
jgi:transcriptional regulator with XRE-family HTH domain